MNYSTKGRKYHWWNSSQSMPDKSLVSTCGHCGLREHSSFDEEAPWRVQFLDSNGTILDMPKRPNCPREPTW